MSEWKDKKGTIVSLTLASVVVGTAAFIVGFKFADTDYFFRLSKSIEILGRVYKEVAVNYVDEIDPQRFGEAGIDGLLTSLDPYTNFINEQEGDEVELITSGKYGGIGITIGLRDGYITVLSLMEGYSAQRQGLMPGDHIIEIEGKSVVGTKPDAVRSMTRGEPGTEVHLKVQREEEPQTMNFVVVREEIQLKNVTYADCIGDGIAYIRLERFARSAGDELRLAIRDLRQRDAIKAVVLDLRDNPGGLLDAAVEVVEKFVPKGSFIVSTRGRKPESEKKYFSVEEPMLPDIPLTVLINHNSASASEIVAGAIQDLDRGVIVGTRSYGKGLVQTVVPIAYGTQLKITTAKYYTPSGRCIQEIDYTRKNAEGVFTVTPDSLRHEFKTAKGRVVFESGGIVPDIVVSGTEPGALQRDLIRRSMYVKFAAKYFDQHRDAAPLAGDAVLLEEFRKFIAAQQFTYQDDGEKKLSEFREIAGNSKYGPAVYEEVKKLEQYIKEAKSNDIRRNWDDVLRSIKMELMSRYKGDQCRIAASIENDDQFDAAVGVLTNPNIHSRLLTEKHNNN